MWRARCWRCWRLSHRFTVSIRWDANASTACVRRASLAGIAITLPTTWQGQPVTLRQALGLLVHELCHPLQDQYAIDATRKQYGVNGAVCNIIEDINVEALAATLYPMAAGWLAEVNAPVKKLKLKGWQQAVQAIAPQATTFTTQELTDALFCGGYGNPKARWTTVLTPNRRLTQILADVGQAEQQRASQFHLWFAALVQTHPELCTEPPEAPPADPPPANPPPPGGGPGAGALAPTGPTGPGTPEPANPASAAEAAADTPPTDAEPAQGADPDAPPENPAEPSPASGELVQLPGGSGAGDGSFLSDPTLMAELHAAMEEFIEQLQSARSPGKVEIQDWRRGTLHTEDAAIPLAKTLDVHLVAAKGTLQIVGPQRFDPHLAARQSPVPFVKTLPGHDRPGIKVVVAIDGSGSMDNHTSYGQPSKRRIARIAAQAIALRIRQTGGECVGVVFEDQAHTLGTDEILFSASALQINGGTSFCFMRDLWTRWPEHYVILITDGSAGNDQPAFWTANEKRRTFSIVIPDGTIREVARFSSKVVQLDDLRQLARVMAGLLPRR